MTTAEDEPKPRSAKSSALHRDLGLLDATMLITGTMIGSGIFITSAESARLCGAPGWLLVAWALAGLMTIGGAIITAELAAMIPEAGGQYVFLRVAYGPLLGFLFGWSMFLVVQTGAIAAVSVAFAKFLGVFWPAIAADVHPLFAPLVLGHYAISISAQQLIALLLILALTAINTRGLRLGVLIQNISTFAKTAALLGLIVIGLSLGIRGTAAAWTSSWWDPVRNGWTPQAAYDGKLPLEGAPALLLLLGLAMIGPLFSQSAWNIVTFTGGETRDPGRSLPRALFLGTTSVVVLYLLANVAYVVSLSLAEIQYAPQDRVGTAAMEVALGPGARYAMAAAILISTFGCVNGLVLAGARVFYAMARDRLFFQSAGTTNAHHVPAVALWAQGLWASALTLPVTVTADKITGAATYGNLYSDLLEYIIPVDVTFCTLMVAAVIALRWKAPQLKRPYRTVGYPIPAILYITLAVFLVADFVYLKPKTSGIGGLIVLAGIPVYLIWQRISDLKTRSPRRQPATEPSA